MRVLTFERLVALKRAVLRWREERYLYLLGAGVLCHGFCALRDCVLGQLTGEEETHGSLDFPTGDGRALVVVSQAGRLGRDPLENVVDEAVHDAHGFGGDTGVGVYLLQHLVDVDSVTLLPAVFPFLVGLRNVLLGLTGFLHGFAAGFSCCHCSLILLCLEVQ